MHLTQVNESTLHDIFPEKKVGAHLIELPNNTTALIDHGPETETLPPLGDFMPPCFIDSICHV